MKKFDELCNKIIKENKKEIIKESIADDMSDEELEAKYDEYLDELYPEIKIEGATLYPSEVLKKCDYPAYREGLNNFIDVLDKEQ